MRLQDSFLEITKIIGHVIVWCNRDAPDKTREEHIAIAKHMLRELEALLAAQPPAEPAPSQPPAETGFMTTGMGHDEDGNVQTYPLHIGSQPPPQFTMSPIETSSEPAVRQTVIGQMEPAPVISEQVRKVRGALARGYCHRKNSHKVLDADLLEAMVAEVLPLLSPATEPSKELVERAKAWIQKELSHLMDYDAEEVQSLAAEFEADRIAFGEKVLEMVARLAERVRILEDAMRGCCDKPPLADEVAAEIRALKSRLPELAKEK